MSYARWARKNLRPKRSLTQKILDCLKEKTTRNHLSEAKK